MTVALPVTDSRLAREFLTALQRARANKGTLTIRWQGATIDDIALVSAFLDSDVQELIGTGIEQLKGMK